MIRTSVYPDEDHLRNSHFSVKMHSPLHAIQSQGAALLQQGHVEMNLEATVPSIAYDQSLRTVDELMRHRAAFYPHEHAISYPHEGVKFVDYSFQQLDVFAWRVAQRYSTRIPAREDSSDKPKVIALLGPSNLEYLISLLALAKLGHTALLLSTRIPQVAIESLIQATGAEAVIADRRHLAVAENTQANAGRLQVWELAARSAFEFPIDLQGDTCMTPHLHPEEEQNYYSFIIHSSGKTASASLLLTAQR